jgi:hypothetical protein
MSAQRRIEALEVFTEVTIKGEAPRGTDQKAGLSVRLAVSMF